MLHAPENESFSKFVPSVPHLLHPHPSPGREDRGHEDQKGQESKRRQIQWRLIQLLLLGNFVPEMDSRCMSRIHSENFAQPVWLSDTQ